MGAYYVAAACAPLPPTAHVRILVSGEEQGAFCVSVCMRVRMNVRLRRIAAPPL